MSEDQSEFYLEIVQEMETSIDALQQLAQDWLTGSAGSATVREMYRYVHNIKGAVRDLGWKTLGDFAHALEDLMRGIQDGVVVHSAALGELMVQCLDQLCDLTESYKRSASPPDVTAMIQQMRACLPSESGAASPAAAVTPQPLVLDVAAQQQVQTALAEGKQVRLLKCEIDPACGFKSVRVGMVIQRLQRVGTVIAHSPTVAALENQDESLQGAPLTLQVLVSGDADADALQQRALSVSEILSVRAEPYDLPPAPPGDAAPTSGQPGQARGATVRVDTAKLDLLMNLIGQLVIERTRIRSAVEAVRQEHGESGSVVRLMASLTTLERVTHDLEEEVQKVRMFPIGELLARFPRLLRKTAAALGTEAPLLLIEGAETELDRAVIEEVADPLMHILNNALAHGLEDARTRAAAGKPERGTIRICARQEEGKVIVEISDDGRGIDVAQVTAKAVARGIWTREEAERRTPAERIQAIFLPGFSTAEQVNQVAGRGVGLDVVQSNIHRLGGSVEVESTPGKGTTFRLRIPLTLAIMPALMVRIGGQPFALPLGQVVYLEIMRAEDVTWVNGERAVIRDGEVVPLLWLRDLFFADPVPFPPAFWVVFVGKPGRRHGLVVDGVDGEESIVVKSLGALAQHVRIPFVTGVTVLGDGGTAPILDVYRLLA